MSSDPQINRRQFLLTTSVVGGAFVLGFVLPSRRAEAATIAEQPWTSHQAALRSTPGWSSAATIR